MGSPRSSIWSSIYLQLLENRLIREQLNQATDELARERCDRTYVEGLRAEWEDFDCIEGFLDSQAKLRKAREDLDSAHDRIRYLIDEVQRLKQSSV